MCVAAFGEIVRLNGNTAIVSLKGAMKEVSIALVPKVQPGDSVVIHAGFATEIVKEPQKLYRDIVATDAYCRHLLDAIEKESKKLQGRRFRIMNFCGTHENTIAQYGIRELLPSNIELMGGPGCPVCVTPEEEIAMGIAVSGRKDVVLTIYGDLMRVPTRWGSLEQLRTQGAKVRMVYDITQALQIAKNSKEEVVHYAVGFETTAPGTAALLKDADGIENFSILSSHRITPPAMEYVLKNSEIDALLCPGHVAMVTGVKPFDFLGGKYKVLCVIGGFEPADVLEAILKLLYRLDENDFSVVNQYSRVVAEQGNPLAQSLIDEVFVTADSNWRGVGILPESRLVLNPQYKRFDAELKFGIQPQQLQENIPGECLCGEVLKGMKPQMCPNFGKGCTPAGPKGPCMVSREGACHIAHRNHCG